MFTSQLIPETLAKRTCMVFFVCDGRLTHTRLNNSSPGTSDLAAVPGEARERQWPTLKARGGRHSHILTLLSRERIIAVVELISLLPDAARSKNSDQA